MRPQQETPNFKPPIGNYSVIDFIFMWFYNLPLLYLDSTCGSNHFKIILENLRT